MITLSLTPHEIDALLVALDKLPIAGLASGRVLIALADKLIAAKEAPAKPRLVESEPATAKE